MPTATGIAEMATIAPMRVHVPEDRLQRAVQQEHRDQDGYAGSEGADLAVPSRPGAAAKSQEHRRETDQREGGKAGQRHRLDGLEQGLRAGDADRVDGRSLDVLVDDAGTEQDSHHTGDQRCGARPGRECLRGEGVGRRAAVAGTSAGRS